MLSETQKKKPSTDFSPADFVPDIRAGMNPSITESFSDETLELYTSYYVEIRCTAAKCVEMVLKTVQDRIDKRPGSGHADERPRAHHDDPAGQVADKERRTAVEKEKKERAVEEEKLRGGVAP